MASRRLLGRLAVGLVLAALWPAAACDNEGDPVTIDWDLSTTHTRQDIGKEAGSDAPAYQFRSVASVRIALPGERVFEADDVQDIRINAEGADVKDIGVVLHPRTAEEAHARASGLAEEWSLRHEGIDDWLEEIQAARKEDGDEAGVGSALATDRVPGPTPFAPSVEILYSFDDERPWVVMFDMYWDPDLP